jgi:hypothetical protein
VEQYDRRWQRRRLRANACSRSDDVSHAHQQLNTKSIQLPSGRLLRLQWSYRALCSPPGRNPYPTLPIDATFPATELKTKCRVQQSSTSDARYCNGRELWKYGTSPPNTSQQPNSSEHVATDSWVRCHLWMFGGHPFETNLEISDEFPPFIRNSVDTTGSSTTGSKPSTRSPASSKSSYAPSTRPSTKSMPPGERSASSEPPSDRSDSVSRNTRRLTPILEAVQEAGFPDIDSMIAAYYSSQFEKSSWPDMAQRASRARRLSKLLVELHEISDGWPKWQSRMFREGVMECASECSYRRESQRSLNASRY